MSALFALPPQTVRVELSLDDAFGAGPLVLTRPRIYVFSAPDPISVEALGRTYVAPTQIPEAIRDLIRAFETYRRQAMDFSVRSQWSDSAARLVSRLSMRLAEAAIES
jgi:hypothetical protein